MSTMTAFSSSSKHNYGNRLDNYLGSQGAASSNSRFLLQLGLGEWEVLQGKMCQISISSWTTLPKSLVSRMIGTRPIWTTSKRFLEEFMEVDEIVGTMITSGSQFSNSVKAKDLKRLAFIFGKFSPPPFYHKSAISMSYPHLTFTLCGGSSFRKINLSSLILNCIF